MFHVVLYQPEIPHNTGAVGRTCVALGAKLWLVRPLGFSLDDRHLKRCGLDYWRHLDWEAVDDWAALVRRLDLKIPSSTGNADDFPVSPRPCFFLTKQARRSYMEQEYRGNEIFVFGRESTGLPPYLFENHEENCLRIPIAPQARSLNLSVSVGIVLFEAARQMQNSRTYEPRSGVAEDGEGR